MQETNDIKNIFMDTFSNLIFYVRDTNLDQYIINKYKKGMIIREPFLCEASFKVGGIFTNCRFAILSNHMVNGADLDTQMNCGLFFADENSYFKVLDISKNNGLTQILLLHLKNDCWQFFKNLDLISSFDLIKLGRDTFNSCLNNLPVFELKNSVWLERCKKPVGMDNQGNFFNIEE